MLWIEMKLATAGQELGESLEDEHGVEAGEAGAALLHGHVHRGEAEAARLGEHAAGDAFGLPSERVRGYAFPAEVAGHVADRHLLFGEGEVHQSSQGLKRFRPKPSKSLVLRVHSHSSWE